MKGGRDPIRIVLDRELHTPPTAQLLPRRYSPTRTKAPPLLPHKYAVIPRGTLQRAFAAGQPGVQEMGSDPFSAHRVQKRGSDPISAQAMSDDRTRDRETSTRTIIVATEGANPARAAALEQAGAEVWRIAPSEVRGHASWVDPPPENRRPDLGELARRLGAEGVQSVLVEGGAEVHASFLAAGLVDRIVLYIAPKIVGGAARSWVGGAGVQHLADAYGFVPDEEISFIGGDLRLSLSVPPRDKR
ncbi:MAG: RibD family protein [Deltaproteobacteria bacterium]|nr:RibD family protein [Deltaproteobacteria bacterium]